ncbi:MAG: DNA-binding response regulator [Persephonella sp.]|nr:MAG: DNA-binding response regulator [Persephonella sp.]
MRVLFIEDDPVLGESIKDFLELSGIETEWIQDDRLVKNINNFETYDVIILDLMLRFNKGEDILKDLRNRGVKIPVIILTAKSDIKDKEVCFNLGADDYLTKPFNPKELLLRLKALANRRHINPIVNIGDTTIDLDKRLVYKNGKEIKLTKRAWDLLVLLLKNRGSVVETNEILDTIWKDKVVGDEIVRAYIKELRKILPKDSIKTYKGRGYKLE